jgi:membrane protein DedA with SNARE-associated domain
VIELLERTEYAGLIGLMFLENVLPPIPSEIIMPWAGFRAASGHLSLFWAIAAGSAGSLAGSSVWYFVALRVGHDRLARWIDAHGRWLGIFPEDLEKAQRAFDRRGSVIVCTGRLIPGVRSLISVPAALAGMPLPRFLLASALGTVAWTAALASGGWALGSAYSQLGSFLNHAATGVFILLVVLVIVRNMRHRAKT